MPTAKKTTKKAIKKAADTVKKVVMSDEAKKLMAVMAEYEEKNPEKFALKKKRLEAKLKSL